MRLTSGSVKQTLGIGGKISGNLKKGDIICLFGEFGSGKTVLTKGIAAGLGIKRDKIVSPSFVLIRQYPAAKIPLNHFDLYRLRSASDIPVLGYEEYLYGEGISVIEWADRLKYLLPKECLKIELTVKSKTQRSLRLIAFGKRYRRLLEDINEDIGT
jgi:tRNA threonylcarbamoyladenosine biosynthesis protein TsaE